MISRFEEAYNEYDFIAKGLGEEAAFALIFKTLETVNPNKAFLDILFSDFPIAICITDPRTPTGERLNLPLDKPTNEQSHRLISWITDHLDPDDSRYQRSDMLKIAPMIKQDLSEYAQILDDGTSIFSDSPTDFLFSEYNDTIDSLLKVDASKGLIYGEVGHGACLFLLLEAILQQLITGIGLLCPLWGRLPASYPNNCCQNRDLFENVWKCTKPDGSKCELWQRMGCLA